MDIVLLLPLSFTVILGITAVVMILRQKKSGAAKGVQIIKYQKGKNSLYMFYRLFQRIPLLNKEFRKVEQRVRILFPADEVSVNIESTRIMMRSLGIFFGVIAVTLITFMGDLYYLAFGLFIAFVMFKGRIATKLEKGEQTLLNQFSEFMSDLISAYRENHGRLDDAINSMIDDLPYFVGLHISKIYEIIKSPHLEEAAEKYADYSPNIFLLSLVSLVVPTRIYGDKELSDGNTTFTKGLMNLKKQLNEEILKRERIDLAFSSLTTISLAAVVVIKPLEWFFLKFFPQTATFFTSPIGLAAMTAIFITSYACYTLVLSLKSQRRDDIKEDTLWKKIAAKPWLNRILNMQYKRHYTKMVRMERELNSIGDHTGVKAHLVKCAAMALVVFIVAHVMFIVADVSTARKALNDFSSEFTNTIVPDESYTEAMKGLSKDLANAHKNDREIDEEALKEEIRAKGTVIKKDDHVDPVVKMVEKRVAKYQKTYFKWWYEPIIFLLATIAFMAPTWILHFKAKAMIMSREDEVNSFNLLAMIFMDMDGIQITTLLEWMERFSYFYREAVMQCIIEVPMGKQKALEKLLAYDGMPDFRKFVKCMMNIDEVGFKKAFADIEIQQDYYNEKRKVDNERLISRKKTKAEKLAFAPIYATIALWLILPIIIYAYELVIQFREAISQF